MPDTIPFPLTSSAMGLISIKVESLSMKRLYSFFIVSIACEKTQTQMPSKYGYYIEYCISSSKSLVEISSKKESLKEIFTINITVENIETINIILRILI